MGHRVSWVATRGVAPEEMIAAAGLRDAGVREAECEVGLWGLQCGEWFVLIGSGTEHLRRMSGEVAFDLSELGETLWCWSTDTSMQNQLTCVDEDGMRWQVQYDGEGGPTEPEMTGDLPDIAASVVAKCQAERATGSPDVDYMYEVVHEMSTALIGYRYDLFEAADGALFWVLEEAPKTSMFSGEPEFSSKEKAGLKGWGKG